MNFGNVKEITIPEGKVSEIIDSAGKSLWKAGPGYIYLKMIDRSISGAYTNEIVESIGDNAFRGCYKLITVNLSAATSIGDSAFMSCSALTTLILRSETIAILRSTNAFFGTPIKSGTGYIYVPAALVDTYKAATNWSTYANQIRAIEDYPEITGGEVA